MCLLFRTLTLVLVVLVEHVSVGGTSNLHFSDANYRPVNLFLVDGMCVGTYALGRMPLFVSLATFLGFQLETLSDRREHSIYREVVGCSVLQSLVGS